MPLRRTAGAPPPLRHIAWLIELGDSLGVNVEEAKRQLRMAMGDYDRGALERAFARVQNAVEELEPAIRLAFGRALKELGQEVDRLAKGGGEAKAARDALEEARRSIASGRFREASEATESCVAVLSKMPVAAGGAPARIRMLPAYPVGRRAGEGDEPEEDDRAEFDYLKREVEHSIAGIRTTGQGTEGEVRALAHATSVWFSGDHARALEELRLCGAKLERRMSALTPSVKCAILAPPLGIRAGKPAKVAVSLKNTSPAEAVDVRVSFGAGGPGEEPRAFKVETLGGGAEFVQDLKVSFPEPGDFTVTAQARYRRAFDAREYESVAVDILTVEAPPGKEKKKPRTG